MEPTEQMPERHPTPVPDPTPPAQKNWIGINKRQCQIITVLVVALAAAVLSQVTISVPNIKDIHDSVITFAKQYPTLKAVGEWMHRPQTNSPDLPTVTGHDWLKGKSHDASLKLMTSEDIAYSPEGKLMLVLVGHVFDVTAGKTYYQPGSGYHGFIGRDGSRAFITGEFNDEGLTDDLSGLEAQDYIGLADWLKFYLNHKSYIFRGYLVGRYFNAKGEETAEMAKFRSWLNNAKEESEKEGDLQKLFPMCNSEWAQDKGSTVWCSDLSGGVDRDWVGFPRKFTEAPEKGVRCACVHANFLADPRVGEYEGCPSDANRCKLPDTGK